MVLHIRDHHVCDSNHAKITISALPPSPFPSIKMADYSIGDRVEVRWKAELFDAAVIKVHGGGKVDVKYDIDGSAGIFLTGLKLLGDEEKKGGGGVKKKVCSVDVCSKNVSSGGLCCAHRPKKPCSVDGCSTKAKARGLCDKHGAKGECVRQSCTNFAVKRGRQCFKHEPKLSCADPDCDTPRVPGKLVCCKHGAHGCCTLDTCTTNAISMRGKCTKHDSKTVACSTEGCSNIAQSRGLCSKHGANGTCSFNKCTSAARTRGRCGKHGGKKVCKEEGCTTRAVARGVCGKHGANGTCKFEGCTSNAQSGSSHCCKHGGGNQKPCSVAGCTTTSKRKGLCGKHGGRKVCKKDGCTTLERAPGVCFKHGARGTATATAAAALAAGSATRAAAVSVSSAGAAAGTRAGGAPKGGKNAVRTSQRAINPYTCSGVRTGGTLGLNGECHCALLYMCPTTLQLFCTYHMPITGVQIAVSPSEWRSALVGAVIDHTAFESRDSEGRRSIRERNACSFCHGTGGLRGLLKVNCYDGKWTCNACRVKLLLST